MITIVEERHAEVEQLCLRHHVARLELFGSAAAGNFNPATSDLDFLVEFRPLPPAEKADAYFGLLHGLQDLFRRKIDLVSAQAAQNRWFEESIQRERRVLYAA